MSRPQGRLYTTLRHPRDALSFLGKPGGEVAWLIAKNLS